MGLTGPEIYRVDWWKVKGRIEEWTEDEEHATGLKARAYDRGGNDPTRRQAQVKFQALSAILQLKESKPIELLLFHRVVLFCRLQADALSRDLVD